MTIITIRKCSLSLTVILIVQVYGLEERKLSIFKNVELGQN